MRIGACQTPEILGDVERALRVVEDFADDAARAGVDLLLFPEGFLQGYLVTEEHVHGHALDLGAAAFAAVLARLGRLRPMLVLGVLERDGDRFFNTAVVIDRGRLVGRYRKTFLTGGESLFTAGTDYPVFDCRGVRKRFGISICADTRFPQAAAAVAAAGADVLLVPAQNMMPRSKAVWWQDRHNEIRAARCRETGMWLVSADVTGERDEHRIGLGPTCVLNPDGAVIAQVPTASTGMITANLGPRRGRQPQGA
jgi:predicted amidohydrolase